MLSTQIPTATSIPDALNLGAAGLRLHVHLLVHRHRAQVQVERVENELLGLSTRISAKRQDLVHVLVERHGVGVQENAGCARNEHA